MKGNGFVKSNNIVFQNFVADLKYLKLSSEKKKLIKNNQKFQKIHNGKRCFVLGNGPSLNLYDLTVLHGEFTFCVNEFVKYNKLNFVKPDYYLLADPKFFDMDSSDSGDKYLIESFQKMFDSFPDVELFIPIYAKNIMEKYSWKANVNYFFPLKKFEKSHSKPYNFSTIIPGMQAVVQYAILLAIYMGFNEIYMLGTEQTNIFGNIRAYMQNDEVTEYAFSMNDEEKRWKNKKLTSYSLPETLRGYARIFELFDELGEYCENQDIKLWNCSPGSLIQGIEKKQFEMIDFKKHG